MTTAIGKKRTQSGMSSPKVMVTFPEKKALLCENQPMGRLLTLHQYLDLDLHMEHHQDCVQPQLMTLISTHCTHL